jgi:hypothetical protein
MVPAAASTVCLEAAKDIILVCTRVVLVALRRRPKQAPPPDFTVKMPGFLGLSATSARITSHRIASRVTL